ncbi:MAG: NUDIX domain-containing protein [Thermodesulfobacteriota bacterium]
MRKRSAGLLMYRLVDGNLEVFLIHMGGPHWAKKDLGAWSIPKGEYEPGEDPFEVAKREFLEETGFAAVGEFIRLKDIKQPGGKIVSAWAVEGDCDANAITSNTFSMEWPPRSGQFQEFPEVDRGGWFAPDIAMEKILKGQRPLIEELQRMLQGD